MTEPHPADFSDNDPTPCDAAARALVDEPDIEGLMGAVFRHLGNLEEVDPHAGGKFLALAVRGLQVRHHFDQCHSGEIERGVELAEKLEGGDREAWLFGYRFVERKGET